MVDKIDFYILENTNRRAKQLFACRLLEKIYQKQQKIFVLTDDYQESKIFDDLLWTFKDISFIPHQLQGEDDTATITIGNDLTKHPNATILLNLSATTIPPAQSFSRLLEIISNDPQDKQRGRERYRNYKAYTCEITHHQIR